MLSKLNDEEFEILSKDIFERKLGLKLYRFPKGRDGGIDLCDKEINPIYVIQDNY